MLKNMKVGTKLLAVLVAPVLVLLILGYVGREPTAQHRAARTQRVEQLANMAAVNANLAHELQREAIYSAAYMASAGTQWKAELAAQRQATDRPSPHYNAAVDKVNPGKESADLTKDVERRQRPPRATSTPSADRSTASRPRPPPPSSQYNSASTDLAQLDTAIAQPPTTRAGPRPHHLRQPEPVKAAEANEAALSVAPRAGRAVPPDVAQHRPGGRALPGRQLELRHLQRPDRRLR